jgi:acetyl esterase/lipase
MQKPMAAAFALLLAAGSADAQQAQIGRYQMVAVPASQAQTFPEALLLDTATGQSWMLYHETGQAIQWLPLPVLGRKGPASDPLAAPARRCCRPALAKSGPALNP